MLVQHQHSVNVGARQRNKTGSPDCDRGIQVESTAAGKSVESAMQQESQQPEGGYPCDMFVTPQDIPDGLKCCICFDVMRDPVQVCAKQHMNCHGCVSKWRKEKKKGCPECRAPLSKNQQPARLAISIIEKLKVRCPHAGPNGDGNSGTTDSPGSSSDVTDADDEHQHKRRRQEDSAGPSSGPASCEWTGLLKDCDAHAAACSFVKISCPFVDAGCGFRAARRDMGAHSSDAAAHLLMVMKRVALVEAEGTAVKAECAEVKAGSEALKVECAALKGRVASLEEDRSSLQRYVSILHTPEEEAATEWVTSLAGIDRAAEENEEDEDVKGTYTGQMGGGVRHGFGRASWVDGDSYDGQWQDDERHGQGIYKYIVGGSYDGQWQEGKKHGRGVYKCVEGDSYDGQWQKGKMHGQGVYKWSDGDTEVGQWENDKQHGRCVYTKVDGTRYERTYEDNVQISETLIP